MSTQPHTFHSSTCNPNPSYVATTTSLLPFNKSHLTSWNRLKHDSIQFNSPKPAHKWMQYQGINNWEGLLDPLDHNLRNEILRYGQFVEAAYRSFDFDVNSPTYSTCRYSKTSLLTNSGMKFHADNYRITKNLRATCGFRLPNWFHDISQLTRVRSSWIGYVAVCTDKNEIARLGRRDVVISLRGTATLLEWLENFRATLTTLPNNIGCGNNNECMVEKGFLSIYVSKTDTCPSLQDMVKEEVRTLIKSYGDEPLSLTITGHSLGAALAILSAYDIATSFRIPPLVTVISFGGPRVGNDKFRSQLEQSGVRILRIVNSDDVITKFPGFVEKSDDVEINKGAHVDLLQRWLRQRVEYMKLVYADVGQELRLSSRESPYVKSGDIATCHDLKTYLHLVECFVSSSSPYVKQTRYYPTQSQLNDVAGPRFGLIFLLLFLFMMLYALQEIDALQGVPKLQETFVNIISSLFMIA